MPSGISAALIGALTYYTCGSDSTNEMTFSASVTALLRTCRRTAACMS